MNTLLEILSVATVHVVVPTDTCFEFVPVFRLMKRVPRPFDDKSVISNLVKL